MRQAGGTEHRTAWACDKARINAEDPGRSFAPGPGLIEIYREPGGQGVRIDSGVYQGFTIPERL